MQPDERSLRDILGCAEEAEQFLERISLDDFLHDKVRQRAIERLVTIIGEAAKQLGEETRRAIDQPWKKIMRLRDKGVHHYNSLTPEILYEMAKRGVPQLAAAVERHLREQNRPAKRDA